MSSIHLTTIVAQCHSRSGHSTIVAFMGARVGHVAFACPVWARLQSDCVYQQFAVSLEQALSHTRRHGMAACVRCATDMRSVATGYV
eukprot:2544675-Alexandrium_andersonii.AAC.1